MDFLRSIGQSLSNGAQYVGDTAKSVGSSIQTGAGVAWDYTADVAATGGILATTTVPAFFGGGEDAPMLPLLGRVENLTGVQHRVTFPFERRAQNAAAVANVQTGSATTMQAPGSSYLYLDVGRWGGSRGDKKRDFGIVCGRTAALCAFGSDSGDATVPATTPVDEAGPINALLGMLGGSSMGAPKVRRALTSKMPLPSGVERISEKVYVIVGDMHLPVITGASTGAQPPEQEKLKGERVGRTRRVDMGKSPGIMSDADASVWHARYVEGEIFQEAGPDLSAFVEMLIKARGNVGADLWLMQLGDMFDLWFGFDCFLKSDPPKSTGRPGNQGQVVLQDMTHTEQPPMPIDYSAAMAGMPMMMPPVVAGQALGETTTTTVTTAPRFIDEWIDRTIKDTTQSPHVMDFLRFEPNASLYLYGNHDNYLAKHVPSELSKLRSSYAKEHHDPHALFYACHGHQWDKFNRDGAVGGLATTQTAFYTPRIRNIDPSSRKDFFLGSATLFRSGQKPFCVFAMGHTHEAFLTEVVIEMDPEPAPEGPDPYRD